jgi:hypothetical protein
MSDAPGGDALVGFVEYELMIARLSALYPQVSRSRIESIAQSEYEAVSGGRIYVVPKIVEEGARERLDAQYNSVVSEGSAVG